MKYKISEPKEIKDRSISNDMIDLLINQIQHELYNHNLYKSFANFYKSKGLDPLYEYYNGRAHEELNHHQWIVDYLNENHTDFKYPEIPEISEDYDALITPFELTLDKEIETTNLIYKIVDLAHEDKDWITLAWLMRSSEPYLVAEQVEFCLVA